MQSSHMIKLINLIGARPQIIKAAAISRAINNSFSDKIEDVIVHTGQHYDKNMSGHFFEQLNIPEPKYNLECGSASHARQTALLMERTEDVLIKEKPDFLLVYGDTNSTLAAALVASKMGIEVIHVEAGLRSFNKSMPEEINRIVCDHVSTLLFCPTKTAVKNLTNEGFNCTTKDTNTPDCPGVIHSGDIMYDNSLYFAKLAKNKSTVLKNLSIQDSDFVLFTMHRDMNTDNLDRLSSILKAVSKFIKDSGKKVVFPVHPRTKKMMKQLLTSSFLNELKNIPNLIMTEPLNFFDITILEQNCSMIVTDSGGIQKESFFFKKPCVVLRPETEWVELIESGNAVIADADYDIIYNSLMNYPGKHELKYPAFYGNGNAANLVCESIINQYKQKHGKK